MLLNEHIERIAEANGGELALPAGAAAGSLNERDPHAIAALLRDVLHSPAVLATPGSICTTGNDGNAVKFKDSNTGKLARDYYFDQESGETGNSIGLKQPGIDEMVPVLREARKIADDNNKLLIASISSIGDEDPSIVIPELAERVMEAGAHGYEANLGCPNKVELSGQRHAITGLDAEATEAVVAATRNRLGTGIIDGYKLSWYELQALEGGGVDCPQLRPILAIMMKYGVDYVSLCNTEPDQVMTFSDGEYVFSELPGHKVGGSGPARAPRAFDQLLVARRVLPESIDIISTNGVFDGREVRRRELAGALLSTMVTRLWHEGEQGNTYGEVFKKVYGEYLAARRAEL